jgi:hypothetical protein
MTVNLSNNGDIINAKCNCVAGASGFCCHVMALLYLIDHSLKLGLETFPRVGTCTDNPQQWHKSRTLIRNQGKTYHGDYIVSLTLSMRRKDFQEYKAHFLKLDRVLHKIVLVQTVYMKKLNSISQT